MHTTLTSELHKWYPTAKITTLFFRQKCTGCEGLLAVIGVTQSGMQRKEMESHMSSKLRKQFFPTTEKKKSMRKCKRVIFGILASFKSSYKWRLTIHHNENVYTNDSQQERKKNYLKVFRAQENKGYKYDYKKVFIR